MALEDDDLAILSARFGVARFGASRFGFYPCEVEGTGHDEPGEYIWKEQQLPTTDWTFVSGCFVCRGLELSISVDDSTPCTGDAASFTSTVAGGAGNYTYAWDFGDSSGTSTEANPDYTYNSAGSYTAALTVTDDWGQTVTETLAMDPYVCIAPPVANFTWEEFTPPSSIVIFTDTSTGSVTSWLWDFGDAGAGAGNDPTIQHPSWDYDCPGGGCQYTVRLTVTGPGGSDWIEKLVTLMEEP